VEPENFCSQAKSTDKGEKDANLLGGMKADKCLERGFLTKIFFLTQVTSTQ